MKLPLLVFAIAASFALRALPAEVTDAENAKLLEEVKSAAKERSARWESCRIEWIESLTYAPGSVFSGAEAAAEGYAGIAAEVGVPATERKKRTPCLLLVHGERMRYQAPWLMVDHNGDLTFGMRHSGYNGRQARSLTRASDGKLSGHDNYLSRIEESTNDALLPLIAFLRFDSANISGRSFRKMHVVSAEAEIAGRKCIEIEGRYERLFFDRERDYLLVQRESLHGENLRSEITVDYASSAESGWRPSRWTIRRYRNGSDAAASTREGRVTHFEPQTRFEPDDFSIVFPAGTRYYDVVKREHRIIQSTPFE